MIYIHVFVANQLTDSSGKRGERAARRAKRFNFNNLINNMQQQDPQSLLNNLLKNVTEDVNNYINNQINQSGGATGAPGDGTNGTSASTPASQLQNFAEAELNQLLNLLKLNSSSSLSDIGSQIENVLNGAGSGAGNASQLLLEQELCQLLITANGGSSLAEIGQLINQLSASTNMSTPELVHLFASIVQDVLGQLAKENATGVEQLIELVGIEINNALLHMDGANGNASAMVIAEQLVQLFSAIRAHNPALADQVLSHVINQLISAELNNHGATVHYDPSELLAAAYELMRDLIALDLAAFLDDLYTFEKRYPLVLEPLAAQIATRFGGDEQTVELLLHAVPSVYETLTGGIQMSNIDLFAVLDTFAYNNESLAELVVGALSEATGASPADVQTALAELPALVEALVELNSSQIMALATGMNEMQMMQQLIEAVAHASGVPADEIINLISFVGSLSEALMNTSSAMHDTPYDNLGNSLHDIVQVLANYHYENSTLLDLVNAELADKYPIVPALIDVIASSIQVEKTTTFHFLEISILTPLRKKYYWVETKETINVFEIFVLTLFNGIMFSYLVWEYLRL